jgi:hypothetical protein
MAKSEKLDLYKLHQADYATPKTPAMVEIKPAQYLTITGRGEPGGELFSERLGALYNVTFTIKMEKKFAGQDYAVCKLEGLWWGDQDKNDFFGEPREKWNWRLIIRTPDFITQKDLKEAVAKLKGHGKSDLVGDVKLEKIKEGKCVQMLHLGSYTDETRTISLMKEFMRERNLAVNGLHHEIYLSDPRRMKPDKLKTILRQPVK